MLNTPHRPAGRAAPNPRQKQRARPFAGLRSAIRRLRTRLIADPRFQRASARFPLTRRIANGKAAGLFDLTAGFVYSQILSACVRLDLPARLAARALTASEVAEACRLPPANAERLLRAGVALDLFAVEPSGEETRYCLGDLGAALHGNPGVAAMVEHHALFYADLADPVALLREEIGETRLSRYWSYVPSNDPAARDPAQAAEYSRLMAVSQSLLADEVLHSYPFARHRRMLDLGGGDGTFAIAAARAFPHLALATFDLPDVADLARARVAAEGLGERIAVHGGNFFEDALPAGADLITLVRVLYDHDDRAALAILAAARRTLTPGGRLLIAETMAGSRTDGVFGDAYFGFYLLAMGGGRPRTAGELAGLCRSAGFSTSRVLRPSRPMITGLLVAFP